MIRKFFGAIQFLTVLPIRSDTSTPGQSAVFFPITGALLGAASGAVLQLFRRPLGASLGALLAISFLVAVTGGLHEDGLADCADAIRAGRTREKMLAILKDSRIGVYGAVALILCVGIRWQATTQIRINPVIGLASSLALSRSSLVMLGITTNPFGSGLGAVFSTGLTRAAALFVALQMLAAAALCGWRGVPMLLSSAAIIAFARTYFVRRLGGVNGDCLGATCLTVESLNLVILAWRFSI